MPDDSSHETIDFFCPAENRNARLMVRWSGCGDDRKLAAIQCDNPRFADLEVWECSWSCWQKVAGEHDHER